MTEHEHSGVEEARAPEGIRGAISAALNGGAAEETQSAEAGDDAQSTDVSVPVQSKHRKLVPAPLTPDSSPRPRQGTHNPPASDPPGLRQSIPEKPLAAPTEWRTSQRELFKSLPEAAQRFLIERHQAMEADYKRKTDAIADLRRDHDAIDAVFAPYRQAMQARAITPRQLIEFWAGIERRLGQGDGVSVIKGIAEGYGIDPVEIGAALGVMSSTDEQRNVERRRGDTTESPEQSAVQIESMLTEIGAIKERLAADDRARTQAARAAEEGARRKRIADLEKFKRETDQHGNLLHRYAAEVENDILDLSYVAQARGQEVPPLGELYERAVRVNPSTYQALRLAEQQSAARQKQEEARAKTAAARRAASSVTGTPGPGGTPDKPLARTLREEIQAQIDVG